MILRNYFYYEAKKSGGMKNKLYCERVQCNRYVIFQVISAVVRIYVLSFTDILKQMVSNFRAECEQLFYCQETFLAAYSLISEIYTY